MSYSEWSIKTIDEMCLLVTDGSHSSPPSVSNGYNMASVKDMGSYSINYETCRKISSEDFLKLVKNGCSPLKGDVLVGKDGANYLEDVIIFNDDAEVVLLSSIAILRPDKNKISSEYLYYLLSDPNNKRNIKLNFGSGSAIPRLVLKNFKKVEFRVPPLEAQKRITSTLVEIDNKIEINNRMNKNLEQMAQTIFKQWFVDFEFPNEQGEPYKSSGGKMVWCEEIGKEIPVGWGIKKLTDLLESVSNTYKFSSNEVVFLNTSDILEGEVLHKNYSNPKNLPGQAKKSIQKGDILFSEIRPANKRFTYIDFEANDYVVSTKLMVLRSKTYVDTELLYLFITNVENLNYLQTMAESRSGTFPQITYNSLESIGIVIPQQSVYEGLADKLTSLMVKKRNNNYVNRKLSEIRDTLLPKLMSGEIDVSNIEL